MRYAPWLQMDLCAMVRHSPLTDILTKGLDNFAFMGLITKLVSSFTVMFEDDLLKALFLSDGHFSNDCFNQELLNAPRTVYFKRVLLTGVS
ncbi:hypothetical protein KFK09_024300 [Dendrobium nobile]|uniref:Uncharacterized protein n=1 Tax=Dendrobium nobile TaxID=94219 RepID=A0A8T3ADE9_DENNO|nr:hypothetical protein KFK09_024300 [Dendrobium nobile]